MKHSAISLALTLALLLAASPCLAAVPVIESVATKGNSSASANVVITKPTGTAEGDLLLAIIGGRTATAAADPGDWTDVGSQLQGDSGASFSAVFYKIAGASEGTDYTFVVTDAGDNRNTGAILRISGHDPTTPINVQTADTSQTTDPSCPTATTTVADCLIVLSAAHVQGSDDDLTIPGSTTERFDVNSGSSIGSSNEGASTSKASAGATGAFQWTGTLGTEAVTRTIAVAPPGGGGGVSIPAMYRNMLNHR